MKRHEDGKRTASIGVERMEQRARERREGRRRKREKKRDGTRVKKKIPRRRRKYFHKIREDDAFEGKPMLVLVRWIRRNPKSVLAVCRRRVSDVNAISSRRKIYNCSTDPPREE
ncbi:Uncharacterized protein DBV15_01302 [Temnothorax longispinosus]|uniref:Uncharacterized protein n=1 Tax=Temnothorax longispinosus TaxID=300112 RepID=A0A4S2KJH9_9HYME|nr:Uncharacterized protein DBV15_01302 [Temnothorax longispinosus]